MPRLFISHSSRNDDWAIALRTWLVREGWSAEDDIFLDLDPERGPPAGQRWARALEEAATRCEAVLFLVSEAWLASKWCWDEYRLADQLNKKLFALLVDDVALERLPGTLTAQWQVVRLQGEPSERFLTVHPHTQVSAPVHVAKASLASLKRGLGKAGIGAETFELQPDASGPLGWRAVYRGLEALEPQDAAVFFGRNADIVRGVDALRGLAARRAPRLLVILGASGAGKSSFLRAGLWPRLARDDSQWMPLKPIRASRGGAIEGNEGLLTALEDVYARFALRTSRAALRAAIATPVQFVALLRELREVAARRAHLDRPPAPLPVVCLDQGEELFAADAEPGSAQLLALARAAIDADAALLLVTIRSDTYGLMQGAEALARIDQAVLPLGPVPPGEIGRIIREPGEVLRRTAGPQASAFDPAVVEQLQQEIAGEADALPLLAFALQRLSREHAGQAVIGLRELEQTGGVAAAIEREAEAALADARCPPDRAVQREVLRRLFIPRLARIDRDSKAPQRRVALQRDLDPDLVPLARALVARRLLVARIAGGLDIEPLQSAATLEVAHEALLRRWKTLAELLTEDRYALLVLDGVLQAAGDWSKADTKHKQDFLTHRGSRLADASALAVRGPDWAREIAPAQGYLAACQERESAEQEDREAERQAREAAIAQAQDALARAQEALAREQDVLAAHASAQAREARLQRRGRFTLAGMTGAVLLGLGASGWLYQTNQRTSLDLAVAQEETANGRAQLKLAQAETARRQDQLDRAQANLLAELAISQGLEGKLGAALRLSVHAVRLTIRQTSDKTASPLAAAALAGTLWQSQWRLMLGGHDGQVSSAAFSPDGARVVTASWDRTARLWDAAAGQVLAMLRGHEREVSRAAFSPDGKRVVTASWDGTARVWDASTGRELAVLRGHEEGVSFAAFSPDGARVVTASFDKTARLWDAATGSGVGVLRGHEDVVFSATFSPDGARVVTASADRTARLWDANTGREVAALRGHEDVVSFASFSPDGSRIVTASRDKTARVWDPATGREAVRLRGHEGGVTSAAFSRDGARIVTASIDKTARLWDAATGKGVGVLRGHEGDVSSAAFSPDGAGIVTASWDATARVWDAATGSQAAVLRGSAPVVTAAAFSADGGRIVMASSDRTARVRELPTGREAAVLRGHEGLVHAVAFSPDGRRIVTASRDTTARIWDAATGRELAVLRGHGQEVSSAAFDPDGVRIVTASYDNTARLWDAATAQEIMVLRGHKDVVSSAAFSPDGRRVVTASFDMTSRVWDSGTGREVALLRGHGSALNSAAFSPDGARIVTASLDRTARLWDAATSREVAPLRGHEGDVSSAAFSADGVRIVTASWDRTARLWDAATQREIAVLRGHEGAVYSATFNSYSTRIVTASEDGTARIWDVQFATMPVIGLINEVCLRRLRGVTTLSREEMRLAGYSEDGKSIDVCAPMAP